MSSSANSRSSSAVRNLRSIFENKASESNNTLIPDSRGRSPNGVGSDKENSGRPKSKVRANFVAVEPVPPMSSTTPETTALRRGSFGEADGDLTLKKKISEQQEILPVPEGAVESAAASAMGTPTNGSDALQLGGGDSSAAKIEQEPANPDKPTTGAEEEPGEMKAADMSNEGAVSGGEALPPVAEDLRPTVPPMSGKGAKKSESKPSTTVANKPPAISTKPSSKPSTSSVKSPVSQPKTPTSAKASMPTASPVAKRPARSSLTAPTAASIARAGASEKPPSSKTSPTAKSKPRETTKPLNMSSHLTAPTASSKAKHGPDAPSAPLLRTTLAHRPKPQTSSAKSRSSLAAAPRPTSRDSSHSARRSLAPVDGSFLDRMTRPTAASASRTTEKVEARSPPSKVKPAPKPKVNGAPKAAPVAKPLVQDVSTASVESPTAASDAPGLSFAGQATTVEDAIAVADQSTTAGSETPVHTNGEANTALEATPAGLAVDDTIR